MINQVVLVGRLTKDPELRKTQNGNSTVRFTLAVDRIRRSATGQKEADFISCVAWQKTAELMAQYLHKGSLIGVTGRIQTYSYDNPQTGTRQYGTDVVADNVTFLESRNASSQYQYQDGYGNAAPQQNYSNPYGQGNYSQNSYGQQSNSYSNPYAGNSMNTAQSQPYQAPVNPYAKPADQAGSSFNDTFDDDDNYDISSDDLPF